MVAAARQPGRFNQPPTPTPGDGRPVAHGLPVDPADLVVGLDGRIGDDLLRENPSSDGNGGGWGGRLNLLLSAAPWSTGAWAEHLPRLLEPMGVTAHRAETAREAEKLIRAHTIHIAVIDLLIPLDSPIAGVTPESGGPRVLNLLSRLDQPPPTVVVKAPRSHRDEHREMQTALRCGAFAVVDRGAADLEMMLQVMQRCLLRFYAGRWPDQPPPPSSPPTTWV